MQTRAAIDSASTLGVRQQSDTLKKSTDELFTSLSEFVRDPGNSRDTVLRNIDSFSSVCDNTAVSIMSLKELVNQENKMVKHGQGKVQLEEFLKARQFINKLHDALN
jgi:hypothetical protein